MGINRVGIVKTLLFYFYFYFIYLINFTCCSLAEDMWTMWPRRRWTCFNFLYYYYYYFIILFIIIFFWNIVLAFKIGAICASVVKDQIIAFQRFNYYPGGDLQVLPRQECSRILLPRNKINI